jgi:hypothetical protein
MEKEVLSGIENISRFPVFSFIVFFAFFLMIGIWVIKSKKDDFESISRIPLNENYDNN